MLLNRQELLKNENYILGVNIIDEKTKYSFNILEKLKLSCQLNNYSNLSELFFMLTYLQTKYMYDIEINIKSNKSKIAIEHKQSCKELTNVLHAFKDTGNTYNKKSCKQIIELFTKWIVKQKEIDLKLIDCL